MRAAKRNLAAAKSLLAKSLNSKQAPSRAQQPCEVRLILAIAFKTFASLDPASKLSNCKLGSRVQGAPSDLAPTEE